MVENKNDTQADEQEKNTTSQKARAGKTRQGAAAGGEKAQGQPDAKGIDFLLDVPLQVSVEVGRTRMLVKDFLQMKEGGVIELDKMADEPLDLYVNSRLIARGEAVVVNDKFGLRLIDVVSTSERLEKLR